MMRVQKLVIDCALDPHEWGWQRLNGQRVPIVTDRPIAPEALLKVIRCNCKTTTKTYVEHVHVPVEKME